MNYTSPLGSNFKLAQSLLAVSQEQGEKKNETPKMNDSFTFDHGSSSGKMKSKSGWNSQFEHSPGWQRNSNNWQSPNMRRDQGPPPASMLYHPSMLEDPWEELEKNLKSD